MWSDFTLFYKLKWEAGGGFQNYVLRLKIVKIMVEASNWHVNTHLNLVSKNMSFSTKNLLFLLMPSFFCKKSVFFSQNSIFTQSINVRAVLENF